SPSNSVCDLQEKFRGAIWQFDKVILTTTKLLKAAHALSLPIYVTTQNRARLGPTVSELQPYLTNTPLLKADEDKTRFSMWLPPIAAHFSPPTSPSSPPKKAQIAIVGIESHICVTQTALDALAAGHDVFVIADGVSSCNAEEVPVALARLRAAGATVTTSESWIYECMGDAGIAEFRDIVRLVKETGGTTKEALGGLLG
ncbi:Isochorismatase hydrolase, partial [Coniochaeta ligniaria NRRL 30616]